MDPQKYPTFWHAVLLFFILLGIQLSLGTFLGIYIAIMGPVNMIGPTLVINSIAFTLTAVIARAIGQFSFKSIFRFDTISIPQILGVIILVPGLAIIISEIGNITRYLIPMPDFFVKMLTDIIINDAVILRFILLVIIAPLTEEVIFRGIILKGFLKNYSPVKGIVLSSLLFALIHLNPLQVFAVFFAGVLLGWLYYKTGSLSLCMLAHALYNATPLIFIHFFVDDVPAFVEQLTGPVEFQPAWVNLAGIGSVILGTAILHFSFKKKQAAG